MTQTLLAIKDGKMKEYPMDDKHALKDRIHKFSYGDEGDLVYGYILNRNKSFTNYYYNWATKRN